MVSPTYTKDGFLFFSYKRSVDTIYEEGIVIEDGKLERTIHYMNRAKVKSLVINPRYTNLTDLSFINELETVDSLRFLIDVDLSVIKDTSRIRELRFNKLKKKVDFSYFDSLEVLGCNYNNQILNLSSCKNLYWMWLDGFPEMDLYAFKDMNVKFLTLYKPRITSLDGISTLNQLQELRIDSAKNLNTLSDLSGLNSQLNYLDIFKAPLLLDYDALI